MKRPGQRLASLPLLFAAVIALCACAKRPADADATPAGASALALDTPRSDVLDCRQHDCADWYRVEVPSKGSLVVDLSAVAAADEDVRISVSLADGQGATLARDQTIGRAAISISAAVLPATYLIAIASNHPVARFDYTVTARLVLPPPPPKPVVQPKRPTKPPVLKPPPAPRFETKRAEVLEIHEDGPHGRTVLLDVGAAQGMRLGLRGRLLDGGRVIAAIEIVEIYPEGCLARIDGAGATAISTSSAVEIDIPIAAAPPGR
jgi:hypothetical protein